MTTEPTHLDLKRSQLSLVDDVGTLLIGKDTIFRGIHEPFRQHITSLFEKGVIRRLEEEDLIPKTIVSDKHIEDFSLLLEQEKISPVIYPFEWSPEMLRKAGNCVLKVNSILNEFGYELKDAHPYNVMFRHSTPLFVDIGSIVKQSPNSEWIALDEFCNCYLKPLKLASHGLQSLYKHAFLLQGTGMSGTDLSLATSILPRIAGKKATSTVQRIRSIYKRGPQIDPKRIDARFKNKLVAKLAKVFLHSPALPFRRKANATLKKSLNSLNLSGKSMWSDYHSEAGFYESTGDIKLSPRMKWVVETVRETKVKSVLELAGNQGILSKAIAKQEGIEQVTCTDYDHHAIDQLILRAKKEDRVSMACFDFMGDIRETLTRERASRLKSDLVIALAVTHHLTLTQNYSIQSILESLSSYTREWIIVEFMPLGLWNGSSAPTLPEWYNEDWFASAFKTFFTIEKRVPLEENRIAYVGKIR